MKHSADDPLNSEVTEQFSVPSQGIHAAAGATERIPVVEPPPVVLKRARPSLFKPPEPPRDEQMVSRNVLGGNRVDKPELSRNRKIAGDLPSWDPTPPGEIHVMPRRSSYPTG